MRNSGLKRRLRERLDIIGLLAFAIAVLFIAFPHLLFSQHLDEIPRAVIYYRYFFVGAFVIFFVLVAIFLVLPKRAALVAASVLGAYALLVLIFDFIHPLGIGLIEEGTEVEPAAPVAGAIQIVLMVGAVFAIYYIPKKVRGVLSWALAAVFLVSGIPFLFAAPHAGTLAADSIHADSESAPDFNIYHMVFDMYYGPWLQWSLEELGRDIADLAGFTHYRRTVSNYYSTRDSYSSFMSGTMYSPDKTVVEWHSEADKSSIIDDLHERGFSTYYLGGRWWAGTRQVQEAYLDDPRGAAIVDIWLATDYWLLRVAPVALRHRVLDERGAGPLSRYLGGTEEDPGGDIRTLVSYRQFQKLLADEHLRPAGGYYVQAYFIPPHPPYQLDRHGNYVGESSYDEQLLLATNMILEFVATLKELGRFEDSAIIVHSDHSAFLAEPEIYAGDPLRDFIQIDEETSDAIREVDVRARDGRLHEARYSVLLLVKPPGVGEEAGDLAVDDGLTQLLDLRGYIKRLLDKGHSAYPEREEVHIHHGLTYQLRDGELVIVGRGIMSGYINHYIIRPGGEWEIADDIPFEYE